MSDDESVDFRLSDAERHSLAWVKIAKFMNDRLDGLRKKNDYHASAEETAARRGAIKELKILLELGEPKPAYMAEYGPE